MPWFDNRAGENIEGRREADGDNMAGGKHRASATISTWGVKDGVRVRVSVRVRVRDDVNNALAHFLVVGNHDQRIFAHN